MAHGDPRGCTAGVGRTDLIAYTRWPAPSEPCTPTTPYAVRARTLAWVVVGMLLSLGICRVTASLTRQAVILVIVGALLAALQKTLCDAARIGPPAHVIYVFVGSAALFLPQRLDQVPGHLALTAVAAPLAHLGPAGLIECCLASAFGAEVLISRAYWLGTICVTPMALLVTEFARPAAVTELMTDRVMDTLIGAELGFAAVLAVTDRRAGVRTARALTGCEAAVDDARLALDAPVTDSAALEKARRRLTAALADLHTVAESAGARQAARGAAVTLGGQPRRPACP